MEHSTRDMITSGSFSVLNRCWQKVENVLNPFIVFFLSSVSKVRKWFALNIQLCILSEKVRFLQALQETCISIMTLDRKMTTRSLLTPFRRFLWCSARRFLLGSSVHHNKPYLRSRTQLPYQPPRLTPRQMVLLIQIQTKLFPTARILLSSVNYRIWIWGQGF